MEIKFDILTVIASGEEKTTRIMYGSNLSWSTLRRTLEGLVAQGFVDETTVDHTRRYHITEKGARALRYYLRAVNGLTASTVITGITAENGARCA
jgi:predicted transcriptional regulator